MSSIITHLPLFIKLPRIDEVVPYGIETAGSSGDWGEKGVAEPNDEDGVLLTKCLASLHTHIVMTTYPSAKAKLEETCHKGDNGNAANIPHRLLTVCQCFARDSDGYGKRHRPHIERQVLGGHYAAMESGHEITNKPRKEEGDDEQGEHLVDDDHKGGHKRQTCLGMSQGKKGGTEQRHYHIDDNGVGRGGCRIASQLLRNNGTCSGSGTDDGKHEALDYHSRLGGGKRPKKETSRSKQQALGEQQPKMPTMGLEVGGLYLAERHEEHDEKQHRLQNLNHREDVGLHLIRQGQGATDIIRQRPTEHRNRQCPVFYELD